jgi:hypothetical protein
VSPIDRGFQVPWFTTAVRDPTSRSQATTFLFSKQRKEDFAVGINEPCFLQAFHCGWCVSLRGEGSEKNVFRGISDLSEVKAFSLWI